MVGWSDGTSLHFVHGGHLGQPLAMTDAMGAVVWRAEFGPFGELLPWVTTAENDLRFPGQWADGESKLLQNWHRDYDPSLGRYIQADPIGLAAGQSLYGYVGGDPVNFVDPMGLSASLRTGGLRMPAGLGRLNAAATAARGLQATYEIWSDPFDRIGDAMENALDDLSDEIADICRPIFTPRPRNITYPPLPITGDFDPPEDECEEQANADYAVCRSLPRSSRGRCWRSAQEKLSACYAGRPIPDLDTWWEPR